MSDVRTEVVDIVAGVLEASPADLDGDPPLDSFEQWDSLHQLNLLLALEEHFGIELAPDDVAQLGDVAAIIALVESRR